MPKKVLRPKALSYLPLPGYPYSAGTVAGGFVHTAGLVPWDETGKVVGIGDVRHQTRQVLSNLAAVLAEAGGTFDDILKCNVYLSDMRHFEAMNEVFRDAFPSDPPARTTVEAALAEPEMLVEIEAVAFVGRPAE
jgi:2-iminobutanoate/2-iminopropanoate deaminase